MGWLAGGDIDVLRCEGRGRKKGTHDGSLAGRVDIGSIDPRGQARESEKK